MKISSSSVHLILMFCVHAVPCILFISDFDIFITSLFVLFCASITIRHCRVSHLFSTFLFFRISFSYYHVHRRTKECMLSAHRNIFGVNKKNMYLFICVCVFFSLMSENIFFSLDTKRSRVHHHSIHVKQRIGINVKLQMFRKKNDRISSCVCTYTRKCVINSCELQLFYALFELEKKEIGVGRLMHIRHLDPTN